ncbi:MAG TPA: hypothetical protein VMT52_02855 [Planctomycetota bacterium]|nr:hypothetical protein [Planctomycetota bacterium]
MDKGTLSTLASASVFAAGFALPAGLAREIVLSTGLLAVSGGITNSLAVKMLFDRIPGLAGSGVIPARFREIRSRVKSLIMEHFFDEAYLRAYLAELKDLDLRKYLKTSGEKGGSFERFVESRWGHLTSAETLDPIIEQEIEKLLDSSVGGLLHMVGPDSIKPAVQGFVRGIVEGLRGKVLKLASELEGEGPAVEIDRDRVASDIRINVHRILERKLEELDPDTLKRLMEGAIRSHLGWLVVWGNVIGAVLGGIAVLLKVSLVS